MVLGFLDGSTLKVPPKVALFSSVTVNLSPMSFNRGCSRASSDSFIFSISIDTHLQVPSKRASSFLTLSAASSAASRNTTPTNSHFMVDLEKRQVVGCSNNIFGRAGCGKNNPERAFIHRAWLVG